MTSRWTATAAPSSRAEPIRRTFRSPPGAPDTTFAGSLRDIGLGLTIPAEGFVSKLSPDGSSLVFSTFLGGSNSEEAWQVAIDPTGGVIVAGHTLSADFPVTVGAIGWDLNGPGADGVAASDGFVVKLDASGTSIDYATFFGGGGWEFVFGLAVDENGAPYVVGDNNSPDFPTTPGVFGPTWHHEPVAPCTSPDPLEAADCYDAYVIKLDATGSGITYATYLGGEGHEHGHAVAVLDGEAYVVGHTFSHDFPTTPDAFDDEMDVEDAFLVRISADGSQVLYGTLLGGNGMDFGIDVAAEAPGVAYVVGMSGSSDFPVTADAADASFAGGTPCTRESGPPVCIDGFFAVVHTDASWLAYATYLGGTGPDLADGIVLRAEDILVAGATYSPEFVVSPDAFQSVFGGPVGQSDAFVVSYTRPTVGVEPASSAGVVSAVRAVWPNPARGAVAFEVEIGTGPGALSVFDVAGRLVCRQSLEGVAPGGHRVAWDGRDAGGARVEAGVYFVRVEGAGRRGRRFLMS